ncbi:hypothetical protein CPB85DRAFT_160671 [Mucidula mucida]|nr:hypothetical protein CPB85DRAFT_160671 [Mucidula mucida]
MCPDKTKHFDCHYEHKSAMTSTASEPDTTSTLRRVDRNIACTDLIAGYCFNADALLKLARHALGKPYQNDLEGVETAVYDVTKLFRSKYKMRLYAISGDEPIVEELENMIISQVWDFPKGYLGYPQDRLPKVEEGPLEVRVREILVKEGMLHDTFVRAPSSQ